ncbi:MAG: hypothetical protein Q7U55_07320, partial [Deltaproteobacteria bacterium]|nr:hypothetical protein [Deltaproteobacteria bacterium]
MMESQKVVIPVKLVLEGINRGMGIQRILTVLKYWVPACAGMTKNLPFRLFTRPSYLKVVGGAMRGSCLPASYLQFLFLCFL